MTDLPTPPLAAPAAPDLADVLVDALGGDAAALRVLALAWRLPSDARWMPIDLLTQGRRHCISLGTTEARERQRQLEDTVAAAWGRLMRRLDPAEPQRLAQALACLGRLTERFPTKTIHDALYDALLQADRWLLAQPDLAQRERCRQVLAPVLVPTWHHTLDQTTEVQMTGALHTQALYSPPDVFVGWMLAWRFGMDRALQYLKAVISVQDLLKRHGPLPLSSQADMDWFHTYLVQALPSQAMWAWLLGTEGSAQEPGYDKPGQLRRIERMLRQYPALSDWHDTLQQAMRAGLIQPAPSQLQADTLSPPSTQPGAAGTPPGLTVQPAAGGFDLPDDLEGADDPCAEWPRQPQAQAQAQGQDA